MRFYIAHFFVLRNSFLAVAWRSEKNQSAYLRREVYMECTLFKNFKAFINKLFIYKSLKVGNCAITLTQLEKRFSQFKHFICIYETHH